MKTGSTLGINLRGEGVAIGIWESFLGGAAMVDTTDSDLSHVVNVDAGTYSSHATTVARIITSKGVNNSSQLGVAPDADVRVYDIESTHTDFASEFAAAVENADLLVSNHSYAFNNGWTSSGFWQGVVDMSDTEDYKFGYYGDWSRTYDSLMNQFPYHLIVRAVANERGELGTADTFSTYQSSSYTVIQRTSPYPEADGGADGYDGLERESTSKNALMVGAVNNISGGYSAYTDVTFANSTSSWGPTDDGRIKPDLVGPGQLNTSGSAPTSYATAVVTGLAALVQELHHDEYGKWLKSSSVKGVLIHTADAASSNGGPTSSAGWGLVNADKAARFLLNEDGKQRLVEASLSNGETVEYRIYLDGTEDFRATLVWTDPKGTSPSLDFDNSDLDDATPILVHDLDLELWNTSGPSLEARAWKLDVANPGNNATRGDNDVDNVERIDWSAGSISAGWYTLRVTHEGVLTDDQEYSLLINDAGGVTFSGGAWSDAPASWGDGVFVHIIDTVNTATLSDDAVISQLVMNQGTALHISEGTNVTVTGEVLMQSGSVGTAQIKGPVSGEITYQSYFSGDKGYRYLSSPVKCTVGEWAEDISRINYSGSGSPSVYAWDAASASWNALSVSDSSHLQSGLIVYLGTNQYARFSILPLSKTSRGESRNRHVQLTLQTDDDTDPGNGDKGWNLVSNPYLASVDWDALDVSQTSGSWYIWNNAQEAFSSSDGSVHLNGGSRYIPPGQSFWVYCSNSSSGSLLLDTAAVTLDVDEGTFKNRSETIRVRVYSDQGKVDEIAVVFSQQLSDDFVIGEDHPKRFSGVQDKAEVFWQTDNIELAAAGVPLRTMQDSIRLMFKGVNADSVVVMGPALASMEAYWKVDGADYPLGNLSAGLLQSGNEIFLHWSDRTVSLAEENEMQFSIARNIIRWEGDGPISGSVNDMAGRECVRLSWNDRGERELSLTPGVYVFRSEEGHTLRFVVR